MAATSERPVCPACNWGPLWPTGTSLPGHSAEVVYCPRCGTHLRWNEQEWESIEDEGGGRS